MSALLVASLIPDGGWHKEWVGIPEATIERAAGLVADHLRTYTTNGDLVPLVGGDKWWQVRGRELEAEWLEVGVGGRPS